MNFLGLCQRAAQECGAADVPSAVTGQTGEALRFVNWVNQAWMELQLLKEGWLFMHDTASFETIDGQPTYTTAECGVTNFGNWDRNSFRCYNTAAGITSEIFMSYLPYEAWRNTYQYGGMRDTRTQPTQMSIAPPDKSICLGPYPAAGYTIEGDYFTVPAYMVADTDLPGLLPERFHMVIVYRAMRKYSLFESAPEVYAGAKDDHNTLMAALVINQLPDVETGGALA